MKALHFGAGNIGRGFIGYLLYKSNYETTFVDIFDKVVDDINKYKRYTVITLSTSKNKEKVENVRAVNLKDSVALEKEVLEADLITTSLGLNNLKSTGELLRGFLKKRSEINDKPLDIIACENALFASDVLKKAILDGADEELKKYLEKSVGFPNCTVDRIVPNVDIEKELPIDVAVEDFYEWDIEKNKVKINNKIIGAEYVEKLDPYLERKLFLLNGAHATIAYLGYLKGYKYIHEAIKDKEINKIIVGFHSEAVQALSEKHKIDIQILKEYSNKLLKRFENEYLKDDVSRVGRDPMRKLSSNDRLITPLKLCCDLKIDFTNILFGVASGYLFNYKEDEKAQGIQNIITKEGIKKAISNVSQIKEGDYLNNMIAYKYEELKKQN
ncbi:MULTISPECIES: mannitol-1-phosphate 5-dehydrogenase [Clostridium]|uniref:Mannitol-1-phosphate 5-dehydrogenase n=1 Tax=Clostridium acetobutylicum (strain ATCC 824 / DSM 792 / JCM 1419 / IAM 19013 / LMG 5710 / NBRC 13948 / NRRL B-527 / VKM B-1787 / 2291 / W) TaxID=272562 RepID=MTLD_CLOAB|nr:MULTISPECIES: mannitol-1-phosphate 5-dehydrogenase [Clostridium]O65992.1 RecName: Full=Mannitol-1-phosphate 5-dehydrogenase [Clostridium acetobutylicum ATCC 824]AAC12851.1 MtlD [Clostridium acetobutylicum ATCC 824]AAK78141.1 Possible sigma factor, diverged member of sigF/sigE/sigG family [Clostridium acetobutylicum ATCC 824]AEI33801.1 mannitol-1-phosphate 5-dehydrogenase [Clostridium acetobutylicum DSM 1731]AWV81947.1 mannitol-1-phosphate 5-dehydrogenase [Clostridium acetobutylicum]MBC2395